MTVDISGLLAILDPWVAEEELELRPKNQITVPAAAVRALGLQPGDRLIVEVRAGELRLRPLHASYAGALAGMYGDVAGSDAYLEGEREAWEG